MMLLYSKKFISEAHGGNMQQPTETNTGLIKGLCPTCPVHLSQTPLATFTRQFTDDQLIELQDHICNSWHHGACVGEPSYSFY